MQQKQENIISNVNLKADHVQVNVWKEEWERENEKVSERTRKEGEREAESFVTFIANQFQLKLDLVIDQCFLSLFELYHLKLKERKSIWL